MTIAPPQPPQSPLLLLTYDHSGVVLWGVDRFLKHLDEIAPWLQRYPHFKIGIENEAYTYDYLAQHHPPALQQIRQYFAQFPGRFSIGTSTYGQPLSAFINDESNIRQISYAIQTLEHRLGFRPRFYLMSEHAFHAQLPQILLGLGFQGAVLRTHFMMYGYPPAFDLPVGWWVGLDGSKIPALPTYKNQGERMGHTTTDNWILTRYPGPKIKAAPSDFYRDHQHLGTVVASRADDACFRKEELVQMTQDDPHYRWVLLEDLFDCLPKPTQDMNAHPNEYQARMPWGYCGGEIWIASRQAENAVLTAEKLDALASLTDGPNHTNSLEQAWKSLLTGQHHDIQICGLVAEARQRLSDSLAHSQSVQTASLLHLANRMEASGLLQLTAFNPHSWHRQAWVQAPIHLPHDAGAQFQLRHGDRIVPSYIIPHSCYDNGHLEHGVIIFQADLPALSLASYSLTAEPAPAPQPSPGFQIDPQKLHLKTPYYQVEFNPAGGIQSLTHATTGQPLLQTGQRQVFLTGRIDGQIAQSQGQWFLKPGPNNTPWVIAQEVGQISGIPYLLQLTFYNDSPRIDCQISLNIQGQRIGQENERTYDSTSPFLHEHKLRLKLFPNLSPQAPAYRDLPFAIASTTEPYVQGLHWAAISDEQHGWAIFNRGAMNLTRENDGGISVPLAYSQQYIWGAKILHGQFHYELALYPFTGSWQQANLHRLALEYNQPCPAIASQPGDGSWKQSHQFIQLDSPNVIASALYRQNGHTLLRLFEHHGQPATITPHHSLGHNRWTPVTLDNQPLETAQWPISFQPWQIRTFRLE